MSRYFGADAPSPQRRRLIAGLALFPISVRTGNNTPQDIRLDFSRRYQEVAGFGTCVNTWQKDVASAYQQEDFLRFYREELGASALRIELWGALAPVARSHWQDISWRDFQFNDPGGRGLVTRAVARRLHDNTEGDIRIIATAWSPPAWMKVNGSLGNGHPDRKNYALNFDDPAELGPWTRPRAGDHGMERFTYLARNKLRKDRYLHFAKLLVEWVRFFRSLGIDLYALSSTNEPRFSHWFSSCVYTPDEYAELIEVVSWMFRNQGEAPIRLFGPEHMSWDIDGNRAYLDAVRRRRRAFEALTAIASHGYIDGYRADLRSESTRALGRLAAPYRRDLWITEGGFGGHIWPAPLHQLAASFVYALRDGGVSLITTWQSLTRHPPDEHALMSVRGPTKKTFAAMQFWRFIRPGMVRIEAASREQLDTVAFEDAGSQRAAIVIVNRTKSAYPVSLSGIGKGLVKIDEAFVTDASRDCSQIHAGLDVHALNIPAESIVTLVLKTTTAHGPGAAS
jgi:O-glycosyl hydrolase